MRKFLMKNIILMVMLISLLISLIGCGSNDASGIGTLNMDDSSGDIGTLGGNDNQSDNDNQGDDSTGEGPSEDSSEKPTNDDSSTTMTTEEYQCSNFTVTIPVGWMVDYDIIDGGASGNNIYVIVSDPNNSHNCFFFIQAMEPFFDSQSAKDAFLPYTDGSLDNAPVLNEISAAGVMGAWTSIYATMKVQGAVILESYQLNQIIEAQNVSQAANGGISSYALGTITIPGVNGTYMMFVDNMLQRVDAPVGLPSSAQYYIGYGNYGLVVENTTSQTNFNTLISCLESFNFDKYSSSQATITQSNSLPQIDISNIN